MALLGLFLMRPRRQLREFYYSSALFSFAYALICIFEPIFLYQQGFPLFAVTLYYALHYICYILMLPLGAKLAARFGLERSLSLAMPIFMLYLLTLAAIAWQPGLYGLAIILLTLHKIFYWPAYHAEFMRFGDGSNRGTELSWIVLLTSGLGVLGPLLGGVIIHFYGYPTLFIITAALLFIACLPLLRTSEYIRPVSLPYTAGWRIIRAREHRRMVLGMIGFAENLVDLVLWPLWMFITLGSAATLGVISSLTTIVATCLGFGIGELNDLWSTRRVLRSAIPLMITSYILRPFIGSVRQTLGADVLAKSAYVSIDIPMRAQLYKNGARTKALAYAIAFETVLALAKATLAGILTILFILYSPAIVFLIGFWLAAALTLLYWFL